MESDLVPVNVVIGDRNFRIKVATEDEGSIRKTIKIINDKILEFRGMFAGKDMQDYISMVLLWYATQPQEAVENYKIQELEDAISKLEDQISKWEDGAEI